MSSIFPYQINIVRFLVVFLKEVLIQNPSYQISKLHPKSNLPKFLVKDILHSRDTAIAGNKNLTERNRGDSKDDIIRQRQWTLFFVLLLYLQILSLNISKNVAWEVGEIGPWRYFFKFVSWRNLITHISIFLSERNMWIAMRCGFAFSKLALHVINQSMLISIEKSRSINQERPVNTNSSSALLFRLDKDYGPREYDNSNKILPSTQASPSYPVNNVSQNFLSNEHLTCQHCNKTYKTETGLNRHKAKYKEKDKPSDNNEHNVSTTSNDNYTAASRTVEYPWSQTGNTISSNTISIIYDKVVF